MKRRLFSILFCVVTAGWLLHAQQVFPIQVNHAQLSAYTDVSQFPSVSSQCQFMMLDGSMEHLHLQADQPTGAPSYAVWDHVGQTFTYHLTVLAYNMAGSFAPSDIFNPAYAFNANWATNVVWDETGTAAPPTSPGIRGTGPGGIKTWGLTVTIDPSRSAIDHSDGSSVPPPHGWTTIRQQVRFPADDIGVVATSLYIPLYSRIDPTAPETDDGFNGHASHFSQCDASSEIGVVNMYIQQPLPILAPINAPWPTVTSSGYDYGGSKATGKAPGTFEFRCCFDFHNGIQGTILDTQTVAEDVTGQIRSVRTEVLDLSSFAVGQKVKVGWIWRQPTVGTSFASKVMEIWSMLVFSVTRGDGTVTPPPPPPPTLTWQPISPNWQQLIDSAAGPQDSFRLCGLNDICTQVIH